MQANPTKEVDVPEQRSETVEQETSTTKATDVSVPKPEVKTDEQLTEQEITEQESSTTKTTTQTAS